MRVPEPKKWHLSLIALLLSGILFIYFSQEFVLASLTQNSKTITTEAQFNQGTLSDTIVTNTSGGEVQLVGGAGNWWNGSWQYRKPITITENSGNTLTNFQIKVTLTTSNFDYSKANADGSDIRFADTTPTALSYWIGTWNPSGNSEIWVKVPSIPASSQATIYIYYGNASATSASDGNGVFDFFDDFPGTSLDSKWTASVAPIVSGGVARFNSGAAGLVNPLSFNLNSGYILEGRIIYYATESAYSGTLSAISSRYTQGGNGGADATVLYMRNSSTTNIYRWIGSGSSASYNIASGVNTATSSNSTWYILGETLYPGGVILTKDGVSVATHSFTWAKNLRYISLGYFAGGTTNEQDTGYDWVFVRKYVSSEPTYALGAEEGSLAPTGTYTSPASGSGVIDLVWNGGWSNNGSGNAFEATANIPTNTSIQFEMRSSTTQGGGWSSWTNLGTATTSGTFGVPASSLASVPTGESRYVQVRTTLTSSDRISNPTLYDYSLWYLADFEPPTNPLSASGYNDNSKVTSLTENTWYNYAAPYFEWAGANDNDSGIDGYYVYFGTDSTAIPQTAGSYQTAANYTANISSANSGRTFYLRIQTKDKAENIYTGVSSAYTFFTYKFDNTPPTNSAYVSASPSGYASNDNFSFAWPAGSDSYSGVKGYEYKRSPDPFWSFTTSLRVSGITSYQNGENFFYVRTVDNAGNSGSGYVQVPYYYNGNAPWAPLDVKVTPEDSPINSFSFSWKPPLVYTGTIAGYYYSINASPNENNSTFTTETSVPTFAAATQVGKNVFYVVAKDNAGNVGWSNAGTVSFYANTAAPGIPTNVNIFDTSDRDAKKYSVALNWNSSDNQGLGFAGYVIERSTDGVNFTVVANTSGTAFIDTELSNIPYYYRVRAKDNTNNYSGYSSTVSETPTGRYTSPPELTRGPAAESKVTTATITWLTDRVASSFVEIGESNTYGKTQGQFEFVTDHTVKVDGLKPSTLYHFRVKYVDVDGNIGYSPDATFITQEAPKVSDVKISDIRLTSAIVTWKTTTVATSKVYFGKTTKYGGVVEDLSSSTVSTHTVKLEGLDDSSLYHLQISGADTEGNILQSDDYTFETLTYPRISNLRLESIKGKATATLKVTWDSNVPVTSAVNYAPVGGAFKETSKSKLETKHEITLSGLLDDNTYTLRTSGRDQFGNEALSDTQTFKTPIDTRPPEISKVSVESSISGTGEEAKGEIVVSWNTDEPATSQVEYDIGVSGGTYGNKTQIDTTLTTSHVVIISDLLPSSNYHFRAISEDAAGNKAKSKENSILIEQAPKSALDLIIRSLKERLGWLFKLFRRK